jgi:hypothetical protein
MAWWRDGGDCRRAFPRVESTRLASLVDYVHRGSREPAQRFAFEVDFARIPASRWTYEFHQESDCTVVTETWTDRRPRWFAVLAGMTMGIEDIRGHNEENIRKTLARLATAAEASS